MPTTRRSRWCGITTTRWGSPKKKKSSRATRDTTESRLWLHRVPVSRDCTIILGPQASWLYNKTQHRHHKRTYYLRQGRCRDVLQAPAVAQSFGGCRQDDASTLVMYIEFAFYVLSHRLWVIWGLQASKIEYRKQIVFTWRQIEYRANSMYIYTSKFYVL